MLQSFRYTALVMVLSQFSYIYTILKVGRARAAHKILPPIVDGPPGFQRAFRVQMNTIEQIIIFLPSLWLFAYAWGDMFAAAIGIFWPIGRMLYAWGYYAQAEKRLPGFGISFISGIILLLGGGAGVVWRLFVV